MTTPQQYRAKLSDKLRLNEKFVEYKFELTEPNKMEFLAGQYVSIKVNDAGERRSYSIASSPEVDHGFELMLDIRPNGIGVQYFAGLNFGDEINFLSPMGTFVVADNQDEALVFIGTGSGIVPLRSMILDLLHNKKEKRPMVLHWGLRYADDLAWEDEFQDLAESYENFNFHPVLSKAPKKWPLCRGRVTNCLDIHDLLPNAGYYICGSKAMIEDVKVTLEKKGVLSENIYHEKFY